MHRTGLTFAFTVAALAAGCANAPHNNVLLFGTDTKVALDISSAATQGGAPQLTIGYRRAEAVWMPLVVNKIDCQAGASNASDCRVTSDASAASLLQGKEETMPKGEDVVRTRTDSYSVFASFGAKFSGGASAAEAQASGGLAQFFATGIAAQKLAENPGMENALKIDNPGAAAGAARELEAQVRLKELEKELGDQRVKELRAKADGIRTVEVAETTLILNRCGGPEKDKTKWDAMLTAAVALGAPPVGLPPAGKFALETLPTNDEVHKKLETVKRYRMPIYDNLTTLCP